jgi:hypothetical protein
MECVTDETMSFVACIQLLPPCSIKGLLPRCNQRRPRTMANNSPPDQVNPASLPKHLPARLRNQARAAVNSGRHAPTKYKTPADSQHLMKKTEFFERFIKNKPRNLYTDDHSITEIFDENATGDSLFPETSQKISVVPVNSCAAARKEKKKGFRRWRLC